MPAPRLAVLDVHETLSDLGPLRRRFDTSTVPQRQAYARPGCDAATAGGRVWTTAFTAPDHTGDGFEATIRSILSDHQTP